MKSGHKLRSKSVLNRDVPLYVVCVRKRERSCLYLLTFLGSFLREQSSSHKAGKKTTSREEEDPSFNSVSSSDDNDELLGEEEDPGNCEEDVPETEVWEDPGDYKEEVPETGVDSTERTESSNMFPVNTVLNS